MLEVDAGKSLTGLTSSAVTTSSWNVPERGAVSGLPPTDKRQTVSSDFSLGIELELVRRSHLCYSRHVEFHCVVFIKSETSVVAATGVSFISAFSRIMLGLLSAAAVLQSSNNLAIHASIVVYGLVLEPQDEFNRYSDLCWHDFLFGWHTQAPFAFTVKA